MRVVRALIAVAGGLALVAVPAQASPAVPAPVDGAVGTASQDYHPLDYRCPFGCYDNHTWDATWVIGGTTWAGVLRLPVMDHDGRVTYLGQFDMSAVSKGVTLKVHCTYDTIPNPYDCLFTLPGQSPRAMSVGETLLTSPTEGDLKPGRQHMVLVAYPELSSTGRL